MSKKPDNWIAGTDYPLWGDNDLYFSTMLPYLDENETPHKAYSRIAKTATEILDKQLNYVDNSLEQKLFDILWNGWLIPSTPVMVNFGTKKGLPISCFGGVIGDSMYDIYRKNLEMAMLSKNGGGTAYDFSDVRPMGAPIRNGKNGTSDGIIPFIKSFDSTIIASKQGRTRRGATAIYLNAEHDEIESFLNIREPKGEVNRQCLNVHQGVSLTDKFMNEVLSGDKKKQALFTEILKVRQRTGEPYIFFEDNANKGLHSSWQELGLRVRQSQLCTEIMQHSDKDHTFTCCLASMNAYKFDEWKDTEAVYLSILLLNAVMQEFLNKAKDIPGIEDAIRQAEKCRALGLGLLGWHSYLQSKSLPFISVMSNSITHTLFKRMKSEAERASKKLYDYNMTKAPLWASPMGRFNQVLLAIAPNRSSSKLAGGVSQGVEPIAANVYIDDDSKGLHIRVNPELEKLLVTKGKFNSDMINLIAANKGSVQNLDFLSKEEKEVFLTFKEINQLELVKQAALRQQYIDQGQSINLAFTHDAPPKWIAKVHIEAWKLGLKSLYYFRSESSLKADSGVRDLYSECVMCEG